MKARDIVTLGDVAFIPLTRGFVAIVDAADVPMVSGVNWCACPSRKTFYAHRTISFGGYQQKVILHRLLMNPPADMHIDHINGNGLDCRRENMRIVTLQQNNLNRGIRVSNHSGLKGVSKQGNKFRAEIQAAGRKFYLGLFETPEEAHAAYCAASASHHREYGRTT